MAIRAIHKLTGKIGLVSEGELAANEHLREATEEEIAQVNRERQIKVYGTELDDDGDLPNDVLGLPDESWTKAEIIAYAEHKKIEVDKSLTKADLLAAILEGAD